MVPATPIPPAFGRGRSSFLTDENVVEPTELAIEAAAASAAAADCEVVNGGTLADGCGCP